jgi:farnesyl-diphosphate farnesyltransferase
VIWVGYFANQNDATAREKSIQLLNELITDALELAPDCLTYLLKLDCQEILRFCAIPQVMAIATLDKLYANPDVFTGVVKIRKGLSCKLISRTNSIAQVHETFHQFAQSILKQAAKERSRGVLDPSYGRTVSACETILDLTETEARKQSQARLVRSTVCVIPLVAAAVLRCAPAAVDRLGGKWQAAIQTGLVLSAVALYRWGPWTVHSDLKPADELKKKTA